MSHTCPDCGQTCYCNGDIDDCCFDSPAAVLHCEHWRECEGEDYDGDVDDYDPSEIEVDP